MTASPDVHYDDPNLTTDDLYIISKAAREFRVPHALAYIRAKGLGLLSYQVKAAREAHYANMRLIMAATICDGFTDGNETYKNSTDAMKLRFDSAADAVLRELEELQKASQS